MVSLALCIILVLVYVVLTRLYMVPKSLCIMLIYGITLYYHCMKPVLLCMVLVPPCIVPLSLYSALATLYSANVTLYSTGTSVNL